MKKNIPIKAAMVFAVFVMLFGIYHIYRTVTQYERARRLNIQPFGTRQ